MRDDQWQQAFNSGRAEADAYVVAALQQICEYHNGFDGEDYCGSAQYYHHIARTALAKYREGR